MNKCVVITCSCFSDGEDGARSGACFTDIQSGLNLLLNINSFRHRARFKSQQKQTITRFSRRNVLRNARGSPQNQHAFTTNIRVLYSVPRDKTIIYSSNRPQTERNQERWSVLCEESTRSDGFYQHLLRLRPPSETESGASLEPGDTDAPCRTLHEHPLPKLTQKLYNLSVQINNQIKKINKAVCANRLNKIGN